MMYHKSVSLTGLTDWLLNFQTVILKLKFLAIIYSPFARIRYLAKAKDITVKWHGIKVCEWLCIKYMV